MGWTDTLVALGTYIFRWFVITDVRTINIPYQQAMETYDRFVAIQTHSYGPEDG